MPKALELHGLTIAEAAVKIRKKELSPVELTNAVFTRIESLESRVKAFETQTKEIALNAAKKAESEIKRKKYRGPLHGIPLGIKDLYNTAGIRTTSSSKTRADYVPKEDCAVVEKFKNAGAIIVGKTVTHEFAWGVASPPTRNPWDLNRIPGGSSGGTGAAVAADMILGGTGSDTGGSIRIPASLTGIAGIKPTFGRVSKRGVSPLSFSLDHAGPMGKTVQDVALMLNVMAGYDARDPTTVDIPVPDFTKALGKGVRGIRIGVPKNFYFDMNEPAVTDAVRKAIAVLEKLGAKKKEVKIPYLEYAMASWYPIIFCESADIHDKSIRTPSKISLFNEDVRTFVQAGEFFLAKHYVKAQRVRRLIKYGFKEVFQGLDVIVAPTVPATASKVDQETIQYPEGEETVITANVRLSLPANLTGLPSLSLPCGFSASKLPIGMQIIGKPFDEPTVLRVGAAYEKATDWHTRNPPV